MMSPMVAMRVGFNMGIFNKIGQSLGFGGTKFTPFNPDFTQTKADIAKVRALADKDPTELRKSSQIQLDQLGVDKEKSFDDVEQQQQGIFANALQQQALTGGLQGGSGERLARQNVNNQSLREQDVRGLFDTNASNIRSSDFADQESLKDQALFAAPQLSLGINQVQAGINANNARADALARAQRKKKRNRTFGLIGAAAGGAGTQSLAGASAGASIGGLFG